MALLLGPSRGVLLIFLLAVSAGPPNLLLTGINLLVSLCKHPQRVSCLLDALQGQPAGAAAGLAPSGSSSAHVKGPIILRGWQHSLPSATLLPRVQGLSVPRYCVSMPATEGRPWAARLLQAGLCRQPAVRPGRRSLSGVSLLRSSIQTGTEWVLVVLVLLVILLSRLVHGGLVCCSAQQ